MTSAPSFGFRNALFIGSIVLGATLSSLGCSSGDPPAEETRSTTANLDTGAAVKRALAYGKALIGVPYGWWYGGGIPEYAPMWSAAGPAPAVSEVSSTNCAGLTNLMLRAVGKEVPGYGGTGSYGEYYWDVAENFDPNRSYPPGTLIGRYYRDVYDQGHVAVVIENGYVLQSYADSYGGTYPGVNDWATVASSHAGYYYEYAVLPENWLGGGSGNGGDCAFGDGVYCGGNGVTGDDQTLYECKGGAASVSMKCGSGCVAEAAGVDDHCSSSNDAPSNDGSKAAPDCAYGDGFYCGGNGVAGKKDTLYKCTAGKASVSETCAKGCYAEPAGTNDWCRTDE